VLGQGGAVGDGDGWVRCAQGHEHWGRHGAAGLLLRWTNPADPTSARLVLLQQRVHWSHQGGTWAVPGGARDSHESIQEAALREAHEEVGLDPADVLLQASWVDDHGGWSYTTLVAAVLAGAARPRTRRLRETAALRWVGEDDVAGMRLHPGFAAAWPHLRAL